MPTWASTLSLWLFGPKDWPSTLALVREKYPQVPQISTAALAAKLDDAAAGRRAAPLLVDTRTPAEYATSRIPGALRAETEAEVRALAAGPNAGRELVLYCSVGYRSSALADRLLRAGVRNVSNLEGSIFTWANEGRPIVNDAGPTRAVHGFDARWSKLLDPVHRTTPGNAK